MFAREDEAETRFARLSRPSPQGLVFHPYGKSGYVPDERAIRHIKRFYAHAWLIQLSLLWLAFVLLPKRLISHWFFASLVVGASWVAIERLVMAWLLQRNPRVATRWPTGEPTPAPTPLSRVEAYCSFYNVGIILLLLVFFAIVSRSIDAWLAAAVCAVIFAAMTVDARRARAAGATGHNDDVTGSR